MVHRKRLADAAVLALVVAGTVFGAIAHAQQAPPGPAAPPTGTGMIAGRVVDAESGQGIAGATVTLNMARPGGASVGLIQSRFPPVLADSQGRFVFTTLPAGTFVGNADRDGYTSSILQRTIEVAAGAQVTDFNFRLTRFNTILGTVRDDVGDPVVGTDVIAFGRNTPQGRPAMLTAFGRARTDDRGEYRLNNLPAGQYVICACNRDAIPFDGQLLTTLAARPLDLLSVARRAAVAGADVASLDSTLRTYAPTFFPNTLLASRAERVALAKGETRMTVDITLTTLRAVRVSGQIFGLPPSSISAASMRLTPVGDTPEAAALTQLPPMLVQPDGRFDFGGVTPGTYTLEVNTVPGSGSGSPSGAALAFLGSRTGPPPPPPPPPPPGAGPAPPRDLLWASETITVGEEDVTGLVVGIQRGLNVRGRIEFAGSTSPPPASAMRGIVQLAPTVIRPARAASYIAQISPDGTFAFILPPGRYVIPEPPSFPPSWATARSITVKGVDTVDAPITVEGDIPDLVITLTDTAPPSVTVTVELPSGEVPEEWSVLIFSSDRRFWKQPIEAIRRFQVARLSAQRTFTRNLPAGEYLLALSRGIPRDWMEASALDELAKGATSLTLVDGDKKTVQVKR